jgi:DNA-binding CsgD family transcriptional regulator
VAGELSSLVIANLREAIQRSPNAPGARNIRLLLDEVDRLRSGPRLEWEPRWDCPLTRRQLQILIATANGQTGRAIAEDLGLHHNTVRKHREAAVGRVGARTPAQAVAICLLHGWFPRAALQLPDVPHQPTNSETRRAYREAAELLRQNPGEWRTVVVCDSGPTARQNAWRLRSGGITAFRPAGAWEAEAFTEGRQHGVRARFVGTHDHAERTAS